MVQGSSPNRGSGTGPTPSDHGGVGGYILAGLILFGALGQWMDRQLGLSFLTPLGLVLGVVAGSYLVYVRVVRAPDESTVDTQGGGSTGMRHERESQ